MAGNAVSVRYGPVPPKPNDSVYFAGDAVSVRYGPLPPKPNDPVYFAGDAVSVRYGPVPPKPNDPAYLAGSAVSVRYGPLPPNPNTPSQIISGAVSARHGAQANITSSKKSAPEISSISVVTATEGRLLRLTIKGKNLSRATEIKFFSESGAMEPNIAVTKIEANPSGDVLTVEATVKEGTSRGRYTVQVMN